jgi:hypothetical protein
VRDRCTTINTCLGICLLILLNPIHQPQSVTPGNGRYITNSLGTYCARLSFLANKLPRAELRIKGNDATLTLHELIIFIFSFFYGPQEPSSVLQMLYRNQSPFKREGFSKRSNLAFHWSLPVMWSCCSLIQQVDAI